MTSVKVVEIRGDDDDDEWGDEEEVVVWSNDLNGTASRGERDSSGMQTSSGNSCERGGHPRGLLIASLANLAISYNVVRAR